MPGAPETRDIGCEVGEKEVCGNPNTEQLGDAYGHVTVTGKIAVDLERKENAGSQDMRSAVLVRICENRIYQYADTVGDGDFLKQAIAYLLQSPHSIDGTGPGHASFDFTDEVARPFNRAGHKLREIGHEKRKTPKAGLDRGLSAIQINGVGHCLEGIE